MIINHSEFERIKDGDLVVIRYEGHWGYDKAICAFTQRYLKKEQVFVRIVSPVGALAEEPMAFVNDALGILPRSHRWQTKRFF